MVFPCDFTCLTRERFFCLLWDCWESRSLQILKQFLRKIERVEKLHIPKYRRFAKILILSKKVQNV